MRRFAISLLFTACWPSVLVAQNHDREAAPFTAIRWAGPELDTPEIRVDGQWFGWTALDDLEVSELLEFCQDTWPSKWRKRVGEDLVEALDLMQRPIGDSVTLSLVDLETREAIQRDDVPMTATNRRLVWHFNNESSAPAGRTRPEVEVQRIEREHSSDVAPEWAYLAAPLESASGSSGRMLERKQAERDLDQLEWLIEHTFSYRDLNGVDYRAAFDAVRAGLAEDVALSVFMTRVSQLLALFGDGHTRLRGLEREQRAGFLPFLVADAEGGVVAMKDDRSGLVDPSFPFLESIDGRSLDEWLTVAQRTIAHGSPQFARFYGLRGLRMLNALRTQLGLDLEDHVAVVLRNADGGTRKLSLPVGASRPIYGDWPRTDEHRLLDDDIGYLRVSRMSSDEDFIEGLHGAVRQFRDTRGLIIDVRGNGGGSRDALRALLPYFLDPKAGPQVANVGAYRMPPGESRGRSAGYLENRSMFPAESKRWSEAERAAIDAFRESFEPAWTPDPRLFSDWHYFVLSPSEEFHYERPVLVLMDSGCFSATDIFLGAFAEVPTVTLIGTPSGGGSGRSRSSTLVESGASVRLSSMASFRPTGQRYDGVGVAPDVVLEPVPSDFVEGGGDSVLRAAIERLR